MDSLNPKLSRALPLAGLFALCAAISTPVPGNAATASEAELGSVIFIHPDGTSTAHWTACRMLYAGPDGDLSWDRLPQAALYRGHVKDCLTPTSNAGATVHAYGVKVAASSYGLDGGEPILDGDIPRKSLLREVLDAGLSAGIVNSGTITEPGTGVFAASSQSRGDNEGIAAGIMETAPHVILGGGEQWFLPEGARGRHGPGRRTDGRDLIAEARSKGYHVAFSREELASTPPDARRLLGLFAAGDTYDSLSEEELRAQGLPAYAPDAPTVAEMAEAAIRVLSHDGGRFLLVIEEEGTDNFGNANNARDCLLALKRADDAIAVARRHLERNPRTLIVTAADSDAGGLGVVGLSADRDIEKPVAPRDRNGAPWDGRDGTETPPFLAMPDARGLRLPFLIAWAGSGDLSGGVLARAEGLNADLPAGIDNTGIQQLMRRTILGSARP